MSRFNNGGRDRLNAQLALFFLIGFLLGLALSDLMVVIDDALVRMTL